MASSGIQTAEVGGAAVHKKTLSDAEMAGLQENGCSEMLGLSASMCWTPGRSYRPSASSSGVAQAVPRVQMAMHRVVQMLVGRKYDATNGLPPAE